MAGDTPGIESVVQPEVEIVVVQNNDNLNFSAEKSEHSSVYSSDQNVKKLHMGSRNNKGSIFMNYSSSLFDTTDERRSKGKSEALHRKRYTSAVISRPNVPHENFENNDDVLSSVVVPSHHTMDD